MVKFTRFSELEILDHPKLRYTPDEEIRRLQTSHKPKEIFSVIYNLVSSII